MADDITYTADPAQLATPPALTPVRTTASTEAGHEGKQIQHIFPDDGSGSYTQPITVAALPLPTGAATEDAQDTGNTSLDNIDDKLGEVQATPTANTLLARLKDLLTEMQLKADLLETQPVSLASVPSHAVTNAGTFAVQTGLSPLTDTQLRATAVPVTTKTALTGSAPAAASVGITSAEAVPANASRTGLVLVNTSTSIISIAFDSSAVLYNGITLNPSGGTFVMDEFTYTTDQIQAIAAAAASNLAIQEFD